MADKSRIYYTKTDEAPALATYSFYPIIEAFSKPSGVDIRPADISLSHRVLAVFPEYLKDDQQVPDALQQLGDLAQKPEANIIKLPNISASLSQLKSCIAELQEKGFDLPDFPDNPESDEEEKVRAKYDKVKGSAVNPVLREGNSDRRAPKAVKNYAKKNPHRMGEWSSDSKSHVSTMSEGDFRNTEKSTTLDKATAVKIELTQEDGSKKVLKDNLDLLDGEVIDAAVLSKKALNAFLKEQVKDAKDKGVLFSVHLKATMMKVSDPIIFGHAVKAYFSDVFEKYGDKIAEAGGDPNSGLASVLEAVKSFKPSERQEIEAAIKEEVQNGPDLAMVDSHNDITNLHLSNNTIIDASMPAMIRTSGQMWNKDDKTQDAKAVIPESSYADLYQETIEFCKKNGAFDPSTMGTVPNVGLMAKKAEEYGSHDKTFEIEEAGTVKVIDSDGNSLLEQDVEPGDLWRMCQVKDAPIQNWVKLAVNRARETGWPTIFWLDKDRAHDAELIEKVNHYLKDFDTADLDLRIMSVKEATKFTLERTKNGENTISVTGNVLRDYLTDLFPILELGTSAKMLSIVPLMNGGGLFETGAGGSAPRHVDQFLKENHLRWDSLGEFLALSVSLDHLGKTFDNERAVILSETLEEATDKFLENNKGPARKVNEIDNRGSHFYLAMYWADALANQDDDEKMKSHFAGVASEMAENEETIMKELNDAQGGKVDLDGYYYPDTDKANKVMRPSATLNKIIDKA